MSEDGAKFDEKKHQETLNRIDMVAAEVTARRAIMDEFEKWLHNKRNKMRRECSMYLRKHGHLREMHIVGQGMLKRVDKKLQELKSEHKLE